MIKLGSNSIGKIYLGSNSIGKAYLGSDLVYQKGGGPSPALPYTPVEYIQTDGVAYINTGILGIGSHSAEIKCVAVQLGDYILSSSDGGENNKTYVMLYISAANKTAGLAFYYFYSNGFPSVETSITNGTPFIARISMKNGAQSMSVKQAGESNYTTVSKTQSATLNSTRTMYLFGTNNGSSAYVSHTGTQVYYCKIYSDETFTTLVRDFIPCVYQGQYGMWDKVSDTFFGNAAASGAFSGPSNS